MTIDTDEPAVSFAAFLNSLAYGLTQARIAELIGMDQATVSRWVNGRGRPDPASVLRIARAFDADPVEALIAAGYLTPADRRHDSIPDPRLLPIETLLAEVARHLGVTITVA